MRIDRLAGPGAGLIRLDLPPRLALDVWFHLHASMHSQTTTRASRVHIVGLLPSLERALVAAGVIDAETCRQLVKAILSEPAPPPIDDAIGVLTKGGLS